MDPNTHVRNTLPLDAEEMCNELAGLYQRQSDEIEFVK